MRKLPIMRTALVIVAAAAGSLAFAPGSARASGGLQQFIDCSDAALSSWDPQTAGSTVQTAYAVEHCASSFAGTMTSPAHTKRFATCLVAAAGSYQPIGGIEGPIYYGSLCVQRWIEFHPTVDPYPDRGVKPQRRKARRVMRSQSRRTRSR